MAISLELVTIRNGQDGTMFDKQAVLEGRAPLMARSKVLVAITGWETMPDPAQIQWHTFVSEAQDLAFDGEQSSELDGKAWDLGGQGVRKLRESGGKVVVLKYMGAGPGTTTAAISVSDGTDVALLKFPKAD